MRTSRTTAESEGNMEYGHDNEKPLDTALRLITEFCDSEYGNEEQDSEAEPDFTDLSNVGIAYTETEEPINGEYRDIQVTADLEKYRIFKVVGGVEVSSENYSSVEEMIPALANLDFDERVALSDEEINKFKKVSAYNEFTADYSSPDFQSEEVGSGYPIMICVNTAEQYAYCLPNPKYDEEFKSAYDNAYEECVLFGKRTCYDYEDYNKIAYQLASKIDYRELLEQGEGDALDMCFAYAYEDEQSKGR